MNSIDECCYRREPAQTQLQTLRYEMQVSKMTGDALREEVTRLRAEIERLRAERDEAMAAGRTVIECADQMRDEANAEIERLRSLLHTFGHDLMCRSKRLTPQQCDCGLEAALSDKGEE
jgi:predicted  nucleic acid-binding Zn-ribbon protein